MLMNQKNPFLHCFFPDSKFIFLQYFMFPGVKPLGAALPAARGWKLPEGHAEHPIKILLKVRQKIYFCYLLLRKNITSIPSAFSGLLACPGTEQLQEFYNFSISSSRLKFTRTVRATGNATSPTSPNSFRPRNRAARVASG